MSEQNVKHENTFEYTYSAKRQEEIEAIRKKYMPKEEDKMELLYGFWGEFLCARNYHRHLGNGSTGSCIPRV